MRAATPPGGRSAQLRLESSLPMTSISRSLAASWTTAPACEIQRLDFLFFFSNGSVIMHRHAARARTCTLAKWSRGEVSPAWMVSLLITPGEQLWNSYGTYAGNRGPPVAAPYWRDSAPAADNQPTAAPSALVLFLRPALFVRLPLLPVSAAAFSCRP